MSRYAYGMLDRDAAVELLETILAAYEDAPALPDDIDELRRRIERFIKNAELFIARLRVVDQGMIDDIMGLKLELDGLYAGWVEKKSAGETKKVVH